MIFIIEEKDEENKTWIVQSLVKVNLTQWDTRLMTELMHWKCFFRWLKLCVILEESESCRFNPQGGGGGGGTLNFSSYVGLGPASALHPKKYQEFQAPPKNIWNFSNPQKISPFRTMTYRKDPKMHRKYP